MELSNAVLQSPSGAILTVAAPSGWLQVGETLTGQTSGATANVASYT
jgi:hypothetical protein